MIEIKSISTLDSAWADERCVLFKHSMRCITSARAFVEMRRFARAHPGVKLYIVNVVESRGISAEVARRTEVDHESPQVIVVHNGSVVWHASHGDVTAGAVAFHFVAVGQ